MSGLQPTIGLRDRFHIISNNQNIINCIRLKCGIRAKWETVEKGVWLHTPHVGPLAISLTLKSLHKIIRV